MRLAAVAGAVLTVALTAGATCSAEATALGLRRVATGLAGPVFVTTPRSEPNRLYVVEQVGRIRVIVGGRLRAAPFLDIRNLVVSGGEQGLLGLAFHPNYARNKRFYVNYTDRAGDTRVVEYRVVRGRPRAARRLLYVDQPYANHNGGMLAFGPDGWLYVGMGDGGAGGDPQNRAQNLGDRLGKLLRISVGTRRPTIQIAGYGLRNPWRFSFDRGTGALLMGDVGQNRWEEINYTPRRSAGLENYGWDVYEGHEVYERKQPNGVGRLVHPIHVYGRAGGNCSVTGGYVYRGRGAAPSLRGRYVFGDFCSGRIWTMRVGGGRASDVRQESIEVEGLSSFGEDARGELYAVSLAGDVFRLVG